MGGIYTPCILYRSRSGRRGRTESEFIPSLESLIVNNKTVGPQSFNNHPSWNIQIPESVSVDHIQLHLSDMCTTMTNTSAVGFALFCP